MLSAPVSAETGLLLCTPVSAETGLVLCAPVSAETGLLLCAPVSAETGLLLCAPVSAETGLCCVHPSRPRTVCVMYPSRPRRVRVRESADLVHLGLKRVVRTHLVLWQTVRWGAAELPDPIATKLHADRFMASMESDGRGVSGILLPAFLALCSIADVWKLEEAARQGWAAFMTMCKGWMVKDIVQTLREGAAGEEPTIKRQVPDQLKNYMLEKPDQSVLPVHGVEDLYKDLLYCAKVSCEVAPRVAPIAPPW